MHLWSFVKLKRWNKVCHDWRITGCIACKFFILCNVQQPGKPQEVEECQTDHLPFIVTFFAS